MRPAPWVCTHSMVRVRSFSVPRMGLIAVCVAGCESPLSPSEVRTLAQAEARWAARGFEDYAIEMRQVCFCPPAVTQWVRVEVRAGHVDRVIVVETGAEVLPAELVYFHTVEQAFNSIRQANHEDWLEDVVAEYDRVLGFPIRVDFIPQRGILDAGSLLYSRNASPLP